MPGSPAKLLLLGEHTVLHGSSALAVPLPRFRAEVHLSDGARPPASDGPTLDFAAWAAYAKTRPEVADLLDVAAWAADATRLAVDSDVPVGYGLGSSGAITAQIFRRYACDRTSSVEPSAGVANALRELEGFFHGTSSGLDPLVSLLERAVRVGAGGRREALPSSAPSPLAAAGVGAWFLLDSGRPRAGREAIAWFGQRAAEPVWRRETLAQMTTVVDGLVAALTESAAERTGAPERLSAKLRDLSRLQLAHLGPLIPQPAARAWRVLAEADLAYLKLCGAGGGGYFLGFAPAGERDDVADALRGMAGWPVSERPPVWLTA